MLSANNEDITSKMLLNNKEGNVCLILG